MNRDRIITIRLTASEYEDLLHQSRSRGLTISRLIRMVLFRKPSHPLANAITTSTTNVTWRPW